MSSLVAIKRRIKSAKNISQITKAMEMVSASKMKRAQESAISSRPFAQKLESIIANIASTESRKLHPLMHQAPNPRTAMLIIVSTNKGLCGGLNVNLFRKIADWAQDSQYQELQLVHVHKRARSPFLKNIHTELVAAFHDLGESVSFEESRSISRLAIKAFSSQEVDQVLVAYPRFVSTLHNEPTIKPLLPLSAPEQAPHSPASEYTFEPSVKNLLAELVPYQVEMSLYQLITEASASEHSARMVAMKAASDNARDLIHNLTLDYNQARQSAVTTELLDATTARMALA